MNPPTQDAAGSRASAGAPRRRLAGCLANLALLGFTAAVTLVALEAVLRFAAHRILPGGEWVSTQSIFMVDEARGVSLRPGSTRLLVTGGAYTARDRINSLGMRGPEPRPKAEAGTPRIVVLGDSFVFGQGVAADETLPARLRERIDGAEVINAGIPGYTLGQEYVFYRERLQPLEPDLVLVGFFMNDLDETRTMEILRDEEGVPLKYSMRSDAPLRKEEARRPGPAGRMSRWLRSHSLLYTIARSRLDSFRYRLARPEGAVEGGAGGGSPPEAPAYMHIFRADPPPSTMERWENAWNTLDALQELVTRGGGRMAVFYIPAEWQVSEEAMAEWASFYGRDPEMFRRRQPQIMLQRWARRSGALFVDLLPRFEGLPRSETYFMHDLHWTARGHDVAAGALVEALQAQGLL